MTDNPTHAELVDRLREDATKLAGWGNSGMGVRVHSAASFIESQASRIEELEAELRALRADAANPDKGMWTFWNDKARKLASEKAPLEAENARLREALEWYADPEIYRPHPQGIAFDRRDLSYHARSALNPEREEK